MNWCRKDTLLVKPEIKLHFWFLKSMKIILAINKIFFLETKQNTISPDKSCQY